MSADLTCLPLPLEGPSRPESLDYEQLRIIITGTPKTGNTWLKHLFSQLYELPRVDLDASFHANDFESFGRRWVGQQHYQPDPDVIATAVERGIVFVAPFRHPGDVLVSLRHHIQNRGPSAETDERLRTLLPESMLEDGENVFGPQSHRFVKDGFYVNLHLTLSWLRGRWAQGVRYEDLWRRPLETFKAVTDRLVPMPERKLRHALSACEIGLMQHNYDAEKKFVRKGGLNSWQTVLPAKIKRSLRDQAPYPAQMAAMGYSMDPADPDNARSENPTDAGNPFKERTFANGIAVAPIHMRAYYDLPDEKTTAWPDACAAGEGTFYQWLMRPTEADPQRATAIPVVTEFAYWLYSIRPDVQQAFPDIFGEHRQQVGDWFLFNACGEYRYDRHFGVPILTSWAQGRP